MKIAVLGVGLLGGSIALELRRCHPSPEALRLWARRRETLDEAVRLGVCGAEQISLTVEGAVKNADLAVICTPPASVAPLAEEVATVMPGHCVITDVASVKKSIVQLVGETSASGRFIGSHPMAGSHDSGVSSARLGLFKSATCIITPSPLVSSEDLSRVQTFWERLGCRIFTMTPEDHDRVVAAISHLPHAVAAALVNFVCTLPEEPAKFCGSGFRDTTRVAGGPSEMWAEIFMLNKDNILAALSGFAVELERIMMALQKEDVAEITKLLEEARCRRAAIGIGRSADIKTMEAE